MKFNTTILLILGVILILESSCRVSFEKRRYSKGYYYSHERNWNKTLSKNTTAQYEGSENLPNDESSSRESENNSITKEHIKESPDEKQFVVLSVPQENIEKNPDSKTPNFTGYSSSKKQPNDKYHGSMEINQSHKSSKTFQEEKEVKEGEKKVELSSEEKNKAKSALSKSVFSFLFILLAFLSFLGTAIDFTLIFFILFLMALTFAALLALSSRKEADLIRKKHKGQSYQGKPKITTALIIDYLVLFISTAFIVLLFVVLFGYLLQ